MLAPIRPRPIIPSCMRVQPGTYACRRWTARSCSAISPAPRRRTAGSARCSTRLGDVGSTRRRRACCRGGPVGHVLTHIARNADSMVRVLDAAERGEVVERYPGGLAGDAEHRGRSRPAGGRAGRPTCRARASALEAAWARQRAAGTGLSRGARRPRGHRQRAWCSAGGGRSRSTAPTSGCGYGPEDWPGEYVREDLRLMEMRWNARRPMGMTGAARPAVARGCRRHGRLAWLLGRVEIEGVEPAGVF